MENENCLIAIRKLPNLDGRLGHFRFGGTQKPPRRTAYNMKGFYSSSFPFLKATTHQSLLFGFTSKSMPLVYMKAA